MNARAPASLSCVTSRPNWSASCSTPRENELVTGWAKNDMRPMVAARSGMEATSESSVKPQHVVPHLMAHHEQDLVLLHVPERRVPQHDALRHPESAHVGVELLGLGAP